MKQQHSFLSIRYFFLTIIIVEIFLITCGPLPQDPETSEYGVTYDGNGSTGGTAPKTVHYRSGDSVTIAEIGDLIKEGYSFTGWKYDDSVYISGNKFIMPYETVALNAQWEKNTYSVTYNGNGNTEGTVPVVTTHEYNTPVTVKENTSKLDKTGYHFIGWNIDRNGSERSNYTSGSTFTIGAGDVMLYAQWRVETYNITYNLDGGTNGKNPETYTIENATSILSDPSKEGYVFGGWFAESSFKTLVKQITNGSTGDKELWAKWISTPSGMVLIKAAGKSINMEDGFSDDSFQVTFTTDFFMDTTEVTQRLYRTLMKATYNDFIEPSWSDTFGIGDNYPVYDVNWYDAVLYCNARTKFEGRSDTAYMYESSTWGGTYTNGCVKLIELSYNLESGGYHLPTEAQWEYACRGGATGDYYWGKDLYPYPSTEADSIEFDSYVVWERNSYNKGIGNPGYGAHPVATKLKNSFGLYDMLGNVREWCNTWMDQDYHKVSQTYPLSGYEPTLDALTGFSIIQMGSCWYDNAEGLRVDSWTGTSSPNGGIYDGFRVCRPAQ